MDNTCTMTGGPRCATDGSGAFICEFCSTSFASEYDLMSHAISCSERPADARYQCEYCGNEYVSEQHLKQHLEDCGTTPSSTEYTCSECREQFESPTELLEHKRDCSVTMNVNDRSTVPRHEDDLTGTVIKYNTDGGYGFIRTFDLQQYPGDDTAVEVFFHISSYPKRTVETGAAVSFDAEKNEEGFEAVNISLIDRREPGRWDGTLASQRPQWGRDS